MATMTTIRGTPNLTIAATRNTAPVYEFRCLYTHDLRKKKKLWHDGSLRYHTFNKRVMVYDDSKNYIGDSHWRDAEELEDGTELKLDKGVLVDVGERIGETLTDLAPLLEKRRAENGSSPPRPPLQPISLATTSRIANRNPQARPKSLADVLGISQGPIGRARFLSQSPYEQLHRAPGQRSHHEEPPAKKPRIGSDKENVGLRQDKVDRRELLPRSNAIAPIGRSDTSESSSLQERRKAAPPKQVIDISSEDEPTSLLSSSPRPATRVKASSRKASGFDGGKHVPAKTVMLPPRRLPKPTPSIKDRATQPKLQAPEPLTVPLVTSLEKSATRSSLSISFSKNKLRLATHKPRKKLMYRELLPASTKRKPQLQTETSPSATREILGEGQPSSRTRNRNVRLTRNKPFSDFESDGDHRGASVENTGLTNEFHLDKHDIDRDLAELFARSSSPLFMPDSQAQAATEVPLPQSIDGSPSLPLAASHTPTSTPSHIGAAPTVKTPLLNKPVPPTPLSKLTLLDRQLMMPPSKHSALFPGAEQPATQPATQSRSLRRVLSENDSPGYPRPDAAMKSANEARPEAMSPDKPKTANQRPSVTPIKLTKSLSDTVARPKVHILPAVSIAEEDTALDCGPWSKVESYLLFDWFPPGRARLMLEGQEQSSSGVMVVKRGLLSDQLDAL